MREINCGYIWVVDFELKSLDIRRYANTHSAAIAMVKPDKNWSLYKLVRVNKRKVKEPK